MRGRRSGPTPIVSVIMAVRNGGSTLEESVVSVCRQSLDRWELLIVDDASTDRTPELIERLSRYEPRIRALASPGLGPAGARNLAIGSARGRFIAILDADDLSVPERLERQVAALEREGQVAAVGSAAYHFVRAGIPVGRQPADPTSREDLAEMMARGALIVWSHSTMCWRRDAIEALEGFDRRFSPSEDAELVNRAVYKHGMIVLGLPHTLVWYRLSKHGLSAEGLRRQRMIARYLELRNRSWRAGLPTPSFEMFMSYQPSMHVRVRWARHDFAAGLYREAGYRVASGRWRGVISRVLLALLLHPRYVLRKLWRQRAGMRRSSD